MNRRSQKYFTDQFQDWKKRASTYLPDLAISLYTAKLSGVHIPADVEKKLGYVIMTFADHSYTFLNERHDPIPFEERLPLEVVLHIQMESLFKDVLKIKKKQYSCIKPQTH